MVDEANDAKKAASEETTGKSVEKQVGRATILKQPYFGEVPIQGEKQNRITPEVTGEMVESAKTRIAEAEQKAKNGLGRFKNLLTKAYEAVFVSAKSVPVDGLQFGGKQYLVDINNGVPGKVISDVNHSPEKLALLENLPAIVQNGEYVGSSEGKQNSQIVRYDHFETETTIAGKPYLVKFITEVYPNVNNYKTHQITKIELELLSAEVTGTPPASTGKKPTLSNSIISNPAGNSNSKNVEGVTKNGTEGNGVSDGSGQRDDGTGAGEQVGGLDRGTEPAKTRGNLSEQQTRAGKRRGLAKDLQKVSPKAIGVTIGTKRETVSVLQEDMYDEELQELSDQLEKETGKKPVFVLGGLQIQTKRGVKNAKGAILSDGTVIIQADHSKYSATQIAKHELFHHKTSLNLLSVPTAIRKIRERFTEAEFGKVVERYLQAYTGIIDIPENADAQTVEDALNKLYEEILADAHAEINAFGAEKFSEEVNEYMAEQESTGTEQTAAATERTTGPPTERFSMAGETAATADIDALQQAQELESLGAADDIIRQETGWFRGDDGKWRFEIDDSKMVYRRSGDARFRQDHPEYVRQQELTNKMLDGTITDVEHQELLELNETWGREHGRLADRVAAGNATLQNLIEHNALFEAYPELRNARVVFGELDSSTRGEYNRRTNTITIRNDLRNAAEDTILHEIQHAVQNIEGFSGGSSVEYWQNRIDNGEKFHKNDRKIQAAEQRYREIFDNAPEDFKNKVREINRAKLAKDFDRMMELEDAIYESEYADLYSELSDADFTRRMDRGPELTADDLYRQTAGENEARDTVARRKLTADERKNTPPKRLGEDAVFAEDGTTAGQAIGRTTNNKPFVKIDRDILAGVAENDWESTVKNNLKQKFPHGIKLGKNDVAIDEHSRKELTFSKYMQQLYNRKKVQLRSDKLRATDNVDEILQATTDWVNEALGHPRKDDIIEFARGNVLLRIGNNDYTAEVLVGKRKGGELTLHDIYKLKKTSFTEKETDAAIAENSSRSFTSSNASISDTSIRNSDAKYNPQNAENENIGEVADDRFSVDVEEEVAETAVEDVETTEGAPVGEEAAIERELQRLQDPAYVQQQYAEGGFDAVQKAAAEVKKLQARLDKLNGVQKPKKPKKEVKPVAESEPVLAKKDLRRTVLDMFSIPQWRKKTLGNIVDQYAERLLRDGRLTEEDRRDFFTRLYASGVIAAEADEYLQTGREARK